MCRLSLSTSKSHVMLIDSRQKLQIVTFMLILMMDHCSTKYLGLYIDEHLTWHKHTQYRVLSRVHCLYRLCPLPGNLLGRLYHIFILPLLDYCDTVWTSSSMSSFKRLERIHSRFCTRSSSNTLCFSD